jgi:membrane-bound inhibitor of C-type lysozyme
MTIRTTWKESENKYVFVSENEKEGATRILGGVNYQNGWFLPWAKGNEQKVELSRQPSIVMAKRTVENYLIYLNQLDNE